MKHLYILIGFLPWILFGILAGHSLIAIDIAVIISLISAIIFNYQTLKKGFILSWGTLIFFVFALVTIVILKNMWVLNHIGLLVNSMLLVISAGSIIVGKPFTEQYAKEKAPEAIWKTPAFKKKNVLITSIWSLLFTVNLLVGIFSPERSYVFNLLNMFLTIFIGFAITILIIEKVKLK